jgi:hypothetical protein
VLSKQKLFLENINELHTLLGTLIWEKELEKWYLLQNGITIKDINVNTRMKVQIS